MCQIDRLPLICYYLEPFERPILVNLAVVLVVNIFNNFIICHFYFSKIHFIINNLGPRRGEPREEKDLVAGHDGVPAALDHVVAHVQSHPLLHLPQPGHGHGDDGTLNL